MVSDGDKVYNGGIQYVHRIGKSKAFIETGIYLLTKAVGVYEEGGIQYDNISYPFLFRFDTKLVYFSGGFSFDYLIAKRRKYEFCLNQHSTEDRKSNIGMKLRIGMEKSFIKVFNLFVEAKLAKNVFSTIKSGHGSIGNGSTNLGVSLGVNYALRQ